MSNFSSRNLVLALMSVVVVALVASTAQAVVIAQYNFTNDANWLKDTATSGGHHDLIAGTGVTKPVSGAGAVFDGTGNSILASIDPIDLRGYQDLTITWTQNFATGIGGNIAETGPSFSAVGPNGSWDIYSTAGGSTSNEADLGVVTGQPSGNKNNRAFGWTDAAGVVTTTVKFDLTQVADPTQVTKVYNGTGTSALNLIAQTPSPANATNSWAPPPSFTQDYLYLGARFSAMVGGLPTGFASPAGTIMSFKISGKLWPTPEPGTMAMLASGLVGLLCYAWRKRK